MNDPAPTSPILAGIALLGAGLLIRQVQPSVLRLPEPEDRDHRDSGMSRAARKSRDGVATILPRNVMKSVARSLMIVGAGLIIVRALDELVEDEETLF